MFVYLSCYFHTSTKIKYLYAREALAQIDILQMNVINVNATLAFVNSLCHSYL